MHRAARLSSPPTSPASLLPLGRTSNSVLLPHLSDMRGRLLILTFSAPLHHHLLLPWPLADHGRVIRPGTIFFSPPPAAQQTARHVHVASHPEACSQGRTIRGSTQL